jgi:hypothetical protein
MALARQRGERIARSQQVYEGARGRVWMERIGAGLAHRRALRAIDERVREARDRRDRAVLDAVEAGASYREVARAAGLSHSRVQQIVGEARRAAVR